MQVFKNYIFINGRGEGYVIAMDGGRRVCKIFFLKNKHFWSNACMKKKNYEIIVKLTRY